MVRYGTQQRIDVFQVGPPEAAGGIAGEIVALGDNVRIPALDFVVRHDRTAQRRKPQATHSQSVPHDSAAGDSHVTRRAEPDPADGNSAGGTENHAN